MVGKLASRGTPSTAYQSVNVCSGIALHPGKRLADTGQIAYRSLVQRFALLARHELGVLDMFFGCCEQLSRHSRQFAERVPSHSNLRVVLLRERGSDGCWRGGGACPEGPVADGAA